MSKLKFEFQDKDGAVLRTEYINVYGGMKGLEESVLHMLTQVLGDKGSNTVSAHMIAYNLVMKDVKNIDGTHFFIKADNEWGFQSAYLFYKGVIV